MLPVSYIKNNSKGLFNMDKVKKINKKEKYQEQIKELFKEFATEELYDTWADTFEIESENEKQVIITYHGTEDIKAFKKECGEILVSCIDSVMGAGKKVKILKKSIYSLLSPKLQKNIKALKFFAIGMVFAAMFNIVGNLGTGNDIIVTAGIINNVIEFFGGETINWINSGSTYMANIVVMVVYIVWNALPFKILILLGGLQSINKQYYDAAKVDGTSDIKYLWKVMIPMAKSTITSILILSMMGTWNAYVWPNLVASDKDMLLVSNGLLSVYKDVDGNGQIISFQMAAAVLVTVPLIIVFLLLRKQIMNGVSRSGIKG